MGRQQLFTDQCLVAENRAFAGTGGVSENAWKSRFLPAFCDADTGRIEIARFKCGKPAPMHLIIGLPDDWAEQRDGLGDIVALKASVVSGFVRDGHFYTREEAANLG